MKFLIYSESMTQYKRENGMASPSSPSIPPIMVSAYLTDGSKALSFSSFEIVVCFAGYNTYKLKTYPQGDLR